MGLFDGQNRRGAPAREPLFHWAGKRRLESTIVEGKRVAPGPNGHLHPCALDIRRWITPPDDHLMLAVWRQIESLAAAELSQVPLWRVRDAKAIAVWRFVVEKVQFQRENGATDFWQLPQETLAVGSGDCEDKSFLAASLLLAAGVPEHRVRVVVGATIRPGDVPSTQRLGGHAWPMYRTATGGWCVLETSLRGLAGRETPTDDSLVAFARWVAGFEEGTFLMADRLAADGRRVQYVPLVCLNHRAVWTVEECQPGSVAAASRFQPDWSDNPTFQQIWRCDGGHVHGDGDAFGPESTA